MTTLALAVDELRNDGHALRVVSLGAGLVRLATSELAHALHVLSAYLRAETLAGPIELRSRNVGDTMCVELAVATRAEPAAPDGPDTQLAELSLWVAQQLVERAGGVLFVHRERAHRSVELMLPTVLTS